MREPDVADVFDDWARRGRGEGMEEGHRQTVGGLLEDLPLGPGRTFLDLGTGVGWAAADAARRGARSVGVDAAPEMLQRARDRGTDASFLRASFEALPLADDAVDVTFSMEALYYAGDLERALGELHRVTAPGGRVHVLVDYYEENEASEGWPEKTGLPMVRLPEAGWVRALEDAGFDDVEARRLRAEPDRDVEAWKREVGTLYLSASKPGS